MQRPSDTRMGTTEGPAQGPSPGIPSPADDARRVISTLAAIAPTVRPAPPRAGDLGLFDALRIEGPADARAQRAEVAPRPAPSQPSPSQQQQRPEARSEVRRDGPPRATLAQRGLAGPGPRRSVLAIRAEQQRLFPAPPEPAGAPRAAPIPSSASPRPTPSSGPKRPDVRAIVAESTPERDLAAARTPVAFALPPDAPLESHLKRLFGWDAFRPGQREAIEAVLAGKDALAVMPTGSGKSLTYCLPAFLLPGVTVVVSPLISLMQDQVAKLEARGLPVTCIASHVSYEEQTRRLDSLRLGRVKLVFVAPERFKSERFVRALAAAKPGLFAVDEAHCVSQWGHDFRPDYLRLDEAARACGRPPILAVTATATPQVRADIARQLALGPELATVVRGFDRPNLNLAVHDVDGGKGAKQHAMERLLKDGPQGTGIIYCATRKNTEALAHALARGGHGRVGIYHAGLAAPARTRVQQRFFDGGLDIVVATNAFGLGIDKQDLRFVYHHDLPGSLEAYYQEAGRAGRDGKPASCGLLFAWQDLHLQRFFIETAHPERKLIERIARLGLTDASAIKRKLADPPHERTIESALRLLEQAENDVARIDFDHIEARARHGEATLQRLVDWATGHRCRRRGILEYFESDEARSAPVACGNCDRCVPRAGLLAGRVAGAAATSGASGPRAAREEKRPRAGRPSAAREPAAKLDAASEKLYSRLKTLRKSIAAKKRTKPFVVMHDRTLVELATRRPTTRRALLEVHGLGETKVASFGDDILAVIVASE